MKTKRLVLLVVLGVGVLAGADGPRWIKATSKDDRFDFAMPVAPREREVNQRSSEGDSRILEYSGTHDRCLYKIEKIESPVAIPEEKLIGTLGASRDAIFKNKQVKLLDDKPATVAGWPARRLTIEAPIRRGQAPCRIAMLICYADNDFYQVRVFALDPGAAPKGVDRFFEAFEPRVKRKPGPEVEAPEP